MNLILVSDGHLTSRQPPGRLDTALDTCIRKFRWLLEFAKQNNACLVQAGDLFNADRDWYILAEIAEALCQYVDTVKVYTVPGQHDKYYRTKQKATNLGVLEKAGLITVLTEQPTFITDGHINGNVVALYGAGWGDALIPPHDLPVAVKAKVLVAHAPIANEGVYPGHEYAKPQTLDSLGYNLILCGDVHRQFHNIGSCDIINTGPIYRHRVDEYNLTHKPSACLWQEGRITWHEIPHEAADVVLSREHLTTGIENRVHMQGFTAKLRSRPTGDKPTLYERVALKIHQGDYNPATLAILKEVMDGNPAKY